MASDHDEVADREHQLYKILAAYFEAVEAGRSPDRDEWLARYPERAEEIAAFLDEQDRLLRLTEPLRPTAGESPAGDPEPAAGMTGTGPTAGQEPFAGSADYPSGTKVRYIGDYELLGEIARGGMGVVFRARQRSLNRPVALKMLLAESLASEADERRFRQEAEAAANLDHPHIVPIFEVGRHDGRSYFSMKLVEGDSLAKRLPDFASDPRASARLVSMVARAVHHAHLRGVLHRDLKPGNILLSGGPETPIDRLEPQVTDFGLARRVEDDPGLTQSGAVLGTPSYMAPEQAIGKKGVVTVATDVYGLGAVLYTILAGRPPFRGDSALETIAQVKDGVIDPPSRHGRRIDRDLETICLKCLEKEPERRYRTADAVAEDLELWLAGAPIRARPIGHLGRAWRWCRRNPSSSSLAAAVVLLLLAIAAAIHVGERARQATARLGQEVRHRERAARRLEYVREVKQASEMLETNRPGEAIKRLTRLRPAPGEEDLREFAWRYLWRVAHLPPPPLRGHVGDVYSATFSPHGRTLATAGKDRTVRLWDTAEGRTRLILPDRPNHPDGHADEVNWVAYSPDGRLLATASDDRTVKVWDAASGRLRSTLPGHSDSVVAVRFIPSGRELVSCGRDGTVIRWDVAAAQRLGSFAVKNGTIQSLAIAPDGASLAIAGERVVVCGLPGGRVIHRLEEAGSQVNSVVFSHDGADLATGGMYGAVRIRDARGGQIKSTLRQEGASVESVAFSPDNRTLASVDDHGIARLWDLPFGSEETIATGQGRLWCVAFSGDGGTLATSSRDATIQLRDLSRDRSRIALRGKIAAIGSIAFSSDGAILAIAGEKGAVQTYDLPRGHLSASRQFGEGTSIWKSALSIDAAWLATVDTGGTAAIWDIRDGHRARTLVTSSPPISGPWIAPDRSSVVMCANDDMTAAWETATGLAKARIAAGRMKCLAFPPRGGVVAHVAWGADRPTLWDLATGEVRAARGPAHKDSAASVAFSPDGRILASGGHDRTIILWDGRTMEELARLTGHTDEVCALAFSPSGRTLASGDHDRTVRLWDVDSRQELAILNGHSQTVDHLAFSPDGLTLATCANAFDGNFEVFLWPAAKVP